jgi:hypothetical protein
MNTRDDEIGFDLARDLKGQLLDRVPAPDAAAILHCCCWLLADVITQSAAQNHVDIEKALALVVVTLTDAVARLALANEIDEADAEATRH